MIIGLKSFNYFELKGVYNLVGKTNARQLILLSYWADGLIGPLSFQSVLCAALNKPGVVVCGGRENVNCHIFPHMKYLYTNGSIDCCRWAGCWLTGNQNKCKHLIKINQQKIPLCFEMIKPYMIVDAIKSYYEGGVLIKPSLLQNHPIS